MFIQSVLLSGIVISGYGQGESYATKQSIVLSIRQAILNVKTADGAAAVPLMVQGLNDVEQVRADAAKRFSEKPYTYQFYVFFSVCRL